MRCRSGRRRRPQVGEYYVEVLYFLYSLKLCVLFVIHEKRRTICFQRLLKNFG